MISELLHEVSCDFKRILLKNDISLIVEGNSRLVFLHDNGEKYHFMDIFLDENTDRENTALRFLIEGANDSKESLYNALLKYSRHLAHCKTGYSNNEICDCGLESVLLGFKNQ